MLIYLSCDQLRTGKGHRAVKHFVKIWAKVLRGCNLLLSAIESDWVFPGTVMDCAKVAVSNSWDGIFRKAWLCTMLEGKDYLSWNNMFSFVAGLIKWSTEYQKTGPLNGVYNATVGLYMMLRETGGSWHRERKIFVVRKERLRSSRGVGRAILQALWLWPVHENVSFIWKHGERIRRSGTLSLFDSTLQEHFNVQNRHLYKGNLLNDRQKWWKR